jgi:hypothetical protein
MRQAFRVFLLIGTIVAFGEQTALAQNADAPIKVALLDNLKNEKLATERYFQGYMDGLKVAKDEAAGKGVVFEFREFFFNKEPSLAIFAALEEMKAWNPDVVIGPRSSDLLLLLRDKLPDTLVLSPLATAEAVSLLPQTFYSFTPPNRVAVKAMVALVKRDFPNKTVFPIIEVDCKSCKDLGASFIRESKDQGVPIRREPSFFVKSTAETVGVKDLLAGYQAGDIVLMPNGSFSSGVLMARISDYLKRSDLVFLGGDSWGDWGVSYTGKFKSSYDYTAMRVTPWSLDRQDGVVRSFLELYRKSFKNPVESNITLISYVVGASLAKVLSASSRAKGPWSKAEILSEFRNALKNEPDLGRPTEYAVYRLTQAGESFVGLTPSVHAAEGKK